MVKYGQDVTMREQARLHGHNIIITCIEAIETKSQGKNGQCQGLWARKCTTVMGI